MTTTSDIVREIRQIEIITNRLVNETMAGSYHSVFKGQGMEFQEVREYAIGDDVRLIDWNVTARTRKPFIKTFREERELTVMLMVDLSGSMYFGSGLSREKALPSEIIKRNFAARIAALLAFSAIRNNDRVGLLLYTDRIEKYIPPHKGRNHVLRVIREVLTHEPSGTSTDGNVAIEYALRMLTSKSIVFMVSDFMLPNKLRRSLSIMNKNHDLIAIRVTDQRELELPAIGEIYLEDPESHEMFLADTSDARLRSAYQKRVNNIRKDMETIFKQLRIDTVDLENGAPYVIPIARLFKKRANRY